MIRKTTVVVAALTPILWSCSGGSSAEKPQTLEPASAPATEALADCTGGAVPPGATNCLLDLGGSTDSYWDDTDGIAPGEAGCHIEYTTDQCDAQITGRAFGEFCLDDDRLVESNPGLDECHVHVGDRGKPGIVSCSAWCQEETGDSGGRCVGGIAVQTEAISCESARCECGAPS